MRIVRLNENKMKVELSCDDLREWNVSIEAIAAKAPEAQKMIDFIFRIAEEKMIFKANRDTTLVRYEADENGEITMLVSKIRDPRDINARGVQVNRQTAEGLPHLGGEGNVCVETTVVRRPKVYPTTIFEFDSFENLSLAAVEIYELYLGESQVYKYNDKYYLKLKPFDSFGRFEIENMLTEFGHRKNDVNVFEGVLAEHATVMIAADALEVIMRMR